MQLLVAELLYHKPQDPKQYIVTYLERTKVAGTKPLFNKQDLHTMFEMCKWSGACASGKDSLYQPAVASQPTRRTHRAQSLCQGCGAAVKPRSRVPCPTTA